MRGKPSAEAGPKGKDRGLSIWKQFIEKPARGNGVTFIKCCGARSLNCGVVTGHSYFHPVSSPGSCLHVRVKLDRGPAPTEPDKTSHFMTTSHGLVKGLCCYIMCLLSKPINCNESLKLDVFVLLILVRGYIGYITLYIRLE